jgi:hypothetical protein
MSVPDVMLSELDTPQHTAKEKESRSDLDCSFVPIGEFATEKEAIDFMAGDRNLMAYET